MRRVLLSLITVSLCVITYAVSHAQEAIDKNAIMAMFAANAVPPKVIPNNKTIVIGKMDPSDTYEPGLVVFDAKSKHIVIVNDNGKAQEFKGVIKGGEVIKYTNTGRLHLRCMVNAKNKLNGVEKMFDKNGKVIKAFEYKDGLRNGHSKEYYPDGKVSSDMLYANGMKNGVFISYFPNGQIFQQGQYKDDRFDGTQCTYTDAGELVSQRDFVAGIPQAGGFDNKITSTGDAMKGLDMTVMPHQEAIDTMQAEQAAWDGYKILQVGR